MINGAWKPIPPSGKIRNGKGNFTCCSSEMVAALLFATPMLPSLLSFVHNTGLLYMLSLFCGTLISGTWERVMDTHFQGSLIISPVLRASPLSKMPRYPIALRNIKWPVFGDYAFSLISTGPTYKCTFPRQPAKMLSVSMAIGHIMYALGLILLLNIIFTLLCYWSQWSSSWFSPMWEEYQIFCAVPCASLLLLMTHSQLCFRQTLKKASFSGPLHGD